MKTISKSRWARNLSGTGFVAIALAAPWPDPRTAFTDVQDVGAPV